MEARREFALPSEDVVFLDEYELSWETILNGSPWLLLHNFPTHIGYNHDTVTAAIRIETGYPDAALDMVYFYPALARKDGNKIGATDAVQKIEGNDYQRWSRHRTSAQPWVPGRDNIENHVFMVEAWLSREFE